MALNGPKIIDGDLANDVYDEFMALYDSGKSVEDVKKEIESSWGKDSLDADEYEIFITTYALALWEVCALSEDILNEVKFTIKKKVTVSRWREEGEEEYAKNREKILEKFILKISVTKKKPRARIKKKESKDFIFQPDDVVLLKGENNLYTTLILADTYQFGRSFGYNFVPVKYGEIKKPGVRDLKECKIFFSKVPTGISEFKYGLHYIMISHGALKKFAFDFELLGKIFIKKEFKRGILLSLAKNKEDLLAKAINGAFTRKEEEIVLSKIIQN